MDLLQSLNTAYGMDIFAELLPNVELKNKVKVRLFDTTKHSSEIFYTTSKYGFPIVYNFQTGITYTPITAYAKAHNLSNSDATKELIKRFIHNDTHNVSKRTFVSKVIEPSPQIATPIKISNEAYETSILQRHKSNLIKFLRTLYGTEVVREVLQKYDVGSLEYRNYDTAFWYKDKNQTLINAKYFAYNATLGKREKSIDCNWYHSHTKQNTPNLGFFGEHLESENIWVVESEKTALIMSIFLLNQNIPNTTVWACGGKGSLLKAFRNCGRDLEGKKIVLLPDLGAFSEWSAKVPEIEQLTEANVLISDYLELHSTPYQQEQKFDIADVLISYQIKAHLAKFSDNTELLKYYLSTPNHTAK
jgi:hypothetical protein